MMRKLRDMCWEAMALSLVLSMNVSAATLARQCGAVGIVTYDLIPMTAVQVELECSEFTYSGSAYKPGIKSIVCDGNALVEGADYTLAYANNVNAGTATITLTGTNLYNGTYATNFTIRPRPLTQGMVGAIGNHPYTGKAQTPKPPVTDVERGVTLREDVEYTLSYANNTAIGDGIVTVTGKGNYTGSIARTFVIEPSTGSELEEVFGGAGKAESDGSGGWIVTLTNDIDTANLPLEIPDNIGSVTIDLNGHDLIGGDGQSAIVIVPGDGDGEPTVLTVLTGGDDATVQGGAGAPAIEVQEGAQDGVLVNIGEGVTVQGGGDDIPAIVGDIGTNEGTVVKPTRYHIPGEGTVTMPKTWKTDQKVTWKAKASKGSVFAHWEGEFVDSRMLSKNELRNPSLAFPVPPGFDTNGIRAVFISVDDDRLGSLALSQPGPLAPNVEVSGLELVDNSESYVTASVSGLPTGLKFDAKTLAIAGKPTKPGMYTVKVIAKNASGYQWAENVQLQVADITDDHIDFDGLPAEGAVGTAYAGQIAAGEFKTLSASGLPTGLKLDAKTGAVAGTPTKGGYFTVTVTATYPDKTKATATWLMTISPVAAVPEPKRTAYHPLTVICATEGGTVSGTGVYADAKKAAIKATAAKGFVFAGWYEDSRLTTPATFEKGDFRTASQNVVVPEMRYVFARFVTTEEDKAGVSLAVDGAEMEAAGAGCPPYQTNVMCGVYMEWPVAVEALSLPTVAVSGLPSGLKFTAKDIVDSKTKQVTVPANTIYGTPTAASKVDAKTGTVKPSVVKVTVTTAGKSKVAYEIDVTVDVVKEWAVGTFDGSVGGTGNGEPGTGGLVTLTVSAAGKVSGKLLEGGKTWTLSAANFDAYDAEVGIYTAMVLGKSGKEAITNEVKIASETEPYTRGVVNGRDVRSPSATGETPVVPVEWTAWQNLWKVEPWKSDAKPFAKAPSLALYVVDDNAVGRVVLNAPPDVGSPYGTLSLKFASSGAVTASGKFVTGQDAKGKDVVYSASCSSVLVPAGGNAYAVYLYFPPKAGKFDGYAAEVPLAWDGSAFSLGE